ncbi:hypothetical protein MsAg5_14860 [Methanosarcinaceae archaeon Ag5]|uniref:Uncharacterized protein n=2 Tax=Methanolapillus africanus TaxID=3028297 RepID=A0AAE4SEA2_9EURY|nr:hypothetical protein [Methanosarcinaceae archaeon Ag5]
MFILVLISIVVLGFVSIIYLQENITDHFKSDSNFQVLNKDETLLSFPDGMNFIYETQLSKVRSIEKWVTPIKIKYEGDPTKEDIKFLNNIIKEFNKIDGFPGMKIVNKDENVLLIYATKETLPKYQEKYNTEDVDKGICHHFSENGEITQAIIIIESDIDQDYKNSVVLHEIFHMVGFYGHYYNNSSIINQNGEPVSGLSATDTLALKMLYNPEILIGMKYYEIREYYQNKEMNDF